MQPAPQRLQLQPLLKDVEWLAWVPRNGLSLRLEESTQLFISHVVKVAGFADHAVHLRHGRGRAPAHYQAHARRSLHRTRERREDGPKFRLNEVQRSEARQRLANGEAAEHLAKLYGVSRATIYRACLRSELSNGTVAGYRPALGHKMSCGSRRYRHDS